MATQLPNDFESGNVQKKPARALGGWLILAVAIVAGLAAAFLAVHTLRSREEAALDQLRASRAGNMIRAVVPVRDIPAGTILDLGMVAARNIPGDTAPADVITPETFDSYAGHRVNVPLLQGKPILSSYLSGRRTLADIIDPDKLAMTFTVDNISTLDGMLQPGDHADVLWFYAGPVGDEQQGSGQLRARDRFLKAGQDVLPSAGSDALEGPAALPGLAGNTGGPLIFRAGGTEQESKLPKDGVRFLERDLKIVATGTRTVASDSAANMNNDPAMTGQPAQFNTVTVELKPEQIQKLVLAKRLGELQLVLRSHDSQVAASNKVYTVRDILGIRDRKGGPLYAADSIEYIVGGTGQNGQVNKRLDISGLRRLADGSRQKQQGLARQEVSASGDAIPRPVQIDKLLPPVDASRPFLPR
ncbi:Flp pilus assembly protein CpaB [Acidithiobacillus sp. CV18-2]|uniref:Flp pilus assembly protein CpaB n=1 Tax=Igneacidithiobacillus copahuensis TaxID=2724909 RepID=A0AAE2YSF7_9PROT|nr:Flp pilus assembly protein CpaB [Acidithiobacillus sp. CV18-3]MBU2758510.1 Flp pilus assembly protein CpaB [Acidithiobacillus sp. BN09-2]MBU2777601.1 Flp pilus assembly protein CpaB [Acidithiobacillus sp. CV18-2]MBU2789238.1 Flp pilus assembly protein CpaB [Igneacidithiobacillus copahuensis]MBU2797695.1 Flp pilus assembly protein CpaB [Acidithiobacillus sp. VAN18-2]MBU2798277.1 Flp pilus assembly protein CpaB [Acidithiobacillus sp. VAN18-4]UTV80686.1 Flp pilus assembly protein CpaB [Acidit